MAVLIKDDDADRMIRELAERTGETITEAVKQAVRERLDRAVRRAQSPLTPDEIADRRKRVAKILTYFDSLPNINEHLTEDEILGYDKNGLPT